MKKILAIDDKKDNLTSIKALFKSFMPDCTVITAQSGAAGISAARQELPDTILLDIIMPEMDGYEVCQRLKTDKLTKHIPVILITAIRTDAESRIKGLENGADAFLAKPIDPAELSAQVNVMLRIKAAEDKLRDKNVNLEALVAERTNELKASEEQFRNLMEQSPLAIQIIDPAGYINRVNQAFMNLWNISRIGLHQVYENYNLLEDEQLKAAGAMPLIEKAFAGEAVTLQAIEYNVLNMMETLDLTKIEGNNIWIQLRLFPVKNSDGEVINIVQMSEDITERKQADIEISKLSAAVEQSPAVIAITDLNGNLDYVNPKFTEVTEYTLEEAIGQKPVILKSGELSDEIYSELWETICAGKVWRGEFHNKKKNGELFWESATIAPIFDQQGNIINFIKVAEDITERRHIENRLVKSEKKYRELFEKSRDAVLIIHDGKFVDCNQAATDILRYNNKAELLNKTPSELSPEKQPDGQFSIDKASKIVEVTLKNGSHRFEWYHKKADGEIFPVEVMLTAISDDSEGKILYTVWRDISGSKQAEANLLKQQYYLSKAQEIGKIGTWELDIQQNILTWTDEIYKIFGVSSGIAINYEKFINCIHPDDRDYVDGKWANALKHEPYDITHRVVAGGKVKWVREKADITFDADDLPIMAIGFTQDITTYKKMEESLRLTQFAVDNSTDAVYWLGADAKFIYINNAAVESLGYSKEELLTMSVHDIGPDFPAEIWPVHWAELKEKKSLVFNTTHQRKDKTIFPVEITASFIIFDGKEINCAIAKDITRRKQAENELQESKQKIENLHEVAAYLVGCEAEADVYRMTVEAAEMVLGFSMVSLIMAEGDILVEKSASRKMLACSGREACLDDDGLVARAYHHGETAAYGCLADISDGKTPLEVFKSGIIAPINHVGVFQVVATTEQAFSQEDARQLELLLDHTGEAIKRIRLQKELKEQATLDPLTNVYNRRYFNRVIEQEISRSNRYGHQIGFMMIDIDNFKQINDTYGHETGDRILQKVADLLVEQVRDTDIVIRYGGDEFLIVLIQTETETETEVIRERIQKAVEERNIALLEVRISIGAVNWHLKDNISLEEALAEADRRMYKAKKSKV
ncbi:MAG: PAS domain S-box protein [Victivallaceae bacterium]|nr:PAS domain S-box protein [Victivallaceae bacterium]